MNLPFYVLWNKLNKPQGRFNDWYRRKIVNKFIESADFITYTQDCVIVNGNGGTQKKVIIMLSIETAKHLAMSTGMDNNSSIEVQNKGRMVRNYFILMEKTLRDYEKWIDIREPQKKGNNELKDTLNEDYKSTHKGESAHKFIFITENDMLNEALLGYKAKRIKEILQYEDKMTREHFTVDINKSLAELQLIDNSLILSNISYQQRKQIINNTCTSKYTNIKQEFDEFVSRIYSEVI
jgi:phage anti-repressor protein